jgi:hypothetical protein
MTNDEYERALRVLLRRPGVDFIRGLSSSLKRDPGYLTVHQEAITIGVRDLLDSGGIFLDTETGRQVAMRLVRDAAEKMMIEERNSG